MGKTTISNFWHKLSFTICLVLVTCSGIFAQSGITVDFKETPLRVVLESVSKQSNYKFVYTDELKVDGYKVSVSSKNESAQGLFNKLFNPINISYSIKGNQVVLGIIQTVAEKTTQSQSKPIVKISGVVVEENGDPLPGVTVQNVTKNKYSSSDLDGKYTIDASQGDKLVFSSIGMSGYETIVGRTSVMNISLKPDAIALADVVVTGYQTLSKERATGSFSVVTAQKMADKLNTNVMDKLEGLTTGLTNYKGTVQVRGLSTINGKKDPLYVVDGVPYEGDISAINPSEIANVTILKDAAAASIYGARSANGVIVISTRGGIKDRTAVEYSTTLSIAPMRDSREYLNLMNSSELVDWQREMFDTYHAPTYDKRRYMNEVTELLYLNEAGKINDTQLDEQLNVYRNRNNYDQIKDNFLRTPLVNQHNISLRGGADKYTYSASANYTYTGKENKGIGSDKFGYNFRSTYQFFKWLKADLGVLGTIGNEEYDNGGLMENNAQSYLTGRVPSYNTIFNEQGEQLNWYQSKSQYEMDRLTSLGLRDESFYPLTERGMRTYTAKNNYLNINIGLSAKIIEGLTISGRYQMENYVNKYSQYYNPESYYLRNLLNNSTKIVDGQIEHLVPEGGYINETRSDKNSYTMRAQIDYNKTFREKHDLTVLVGAERRAIRSTSTFVEKWGYDKLSLAHSFIDEVVLNQTQPGTESLDNSYTHKSGGYPDTFKDKEDRFVSFYGNASYVYNDKYSVSGSIRMDQSNLFGTDPKFQYKPLWSVGASWLANKENFLKGVRWIDQLSLRATYGINGNIAKDSGPYLIAYSSGITSWTGDFASSISSPPNSGLRWEKTNQLNIGVDFSLFSNRLGGSIEYYSKNTKDLLGDVAVDPTSGWTSLQLNYASMFNKGVEISLNSENIRTRKFTWGTSLNFSYNKNEITEFENSESSVSSYLTRPNTREGKPFNALYSVRWAGLDETGKPQAYKADGTIVNTTGKLTAEDLVYSGTTTPPYAASLINNLSYKKFRLSFMFLYYGGHVMRDIMPQMLTSTSFSTNQNKNIANYWKNPGDERDSNISPAYTRNASSTSTYLWYGADKHIKKANYIKFKEITISYNLQNEWLKRARIESITLNAQIENIWWWGSNNKDLNPENWNGTNIYMGGPSYLTRTALNPTTFIFGLSIKF